MKTCAEVAAEYVREANKPPETFNSTIVDDFIEKFQACSDFPKQCKHEIGNNGGTGPEGSWVSCLHCGKRLKAKITITLDEE